MRGDTVTGPGWTDERAPIAHSMPATSHRLVCDALRQALQAGPAGGPGSIRYRACAVLYSLLLDHPLDQRGRCRSCRRSGAMIGLRRRPCRIHLRASYWLLRQPDEALLPWHFADAPEFTTTLATPGRAPCPR